MSGRVKVVIGNRARPPRVDPTAWATSRKEALHRAKMNRAEAKSNNREVIRKLQTQGTDVESMEVLDSLEREMAQTRTLSKRVPSRRSQPSHNQFDDCCRESQSIGSSRAHSSQSSTIATYRDNVDDSVSNDSGRSKMGDMFNHFASANLQNQIQHHGAHRGRGRRRCAPLMVADEDRSGPHQHHVRDDLRTMLDPSSDKIESRKLSLLKQRLNARKQQRQILLGIVKLGRGVEGVRSEDAALVTTTRYLQDDEGSLEPMGSVLEQQTKPDGVDWSEQSTRPMRTDFVANNRYSNQDKQPISLSNENSNRLEVLSAHSNAMSSQKQATSSYVWDQGCNSGEGTPRCIRPDGVGALNRDEMPIGQDLSTDFDVEELSQVEIRLIFCNHCGRSSSKERYERFCRALNRDGVPLCVEMFCKKKRKVYNSAKTRIRSMGLNDDERRIVTAGRRKVVSEMKAKMNGKMNKSRPKQQKWKEESNTFREAMRTNRLVAKAEAEGRPAHYYLT